MPTKAFCSWSGGKDSCLCMDRARREGIRIDSLFTMMELGGGVSRGHGTPIWALKRQAIAMDLPIVTQEAEWSDYENKFVTQMQQFRENGFDTAVFGDIDIESRKEWEESVCKKVQFKAILPLWKISRRQIVHEFISLGYQALIVVVKKSILPSSFVGRIYNESLISELDALGVDPCAEDGEFHTFVVDGPLFRHRVQFNADGVIHGGGYALLNLIP